MLYNTPRFHPCCAKLIAPLLIDFNAVIRHSLSLGHLKNLSHKILRILFPSYIFKILGNTKKYYLRFCILSDEKSTAQYLHAKFFRCPFCRLRRHSAVVGICGNVYLSFSTLDRLSGNSLCKYTFCFIDLYNYYNIQTISLLNRYVKNNLASVYLDSVLDAVNFSNLECAAVFAVERPGQFCTEAFNYKMAAL